MFTFGIFTTHLPYITIVAFYAYFLIFGVNQPTDGKITTAKESISVQIHLNNSIEQTPADTFNFYTSLSEISETYCFENSKVKQKWKHLGVNKIFKQDHCKSTLFSRPPPALA
jgi:hypothetical protein